MQILLSGDWLVTRPIRPEGSDLRRVLKSVRSHNVVFGNIETLFHDYERPPMAQSGGTWLRTDPLVAKDLRRSGLTLGSLANNHAGDYGPETLMTSIRYLTKAGIQCAGAGADLASARAATVQRVEDRTIALVAASSTFPAHAAASRAVGPIKARPGISTLRFRAIYDLDRETLDNLQSLNETLERPLLPDKEAHIAAHRGAQNVVFRPGAQTKRSTEPIKEDLAAICSVVAAAKHEFDFVIARLHVHTSEGADPAAPPQFMREAARAIVEAGADVVAGHGPHLVRGIEVIDGAPVFYGLGSFVFQPHLMHEQPYDAFEEFGLPLTQALFS